MNIQKQAFIQGYMHKEAARGDQLDSLVRSLKKLGWRNKAREIEKLTKSHLVHDPGLLSPGRHKLTVAPRSGLYAEEKDILKELVPEARQLVKDKQVHWDYADNPIDRAVTRRLDYALKEHPVKTNAAILGGLGATGAGIALPLALSGDDE